jgi:hypothetical protein
MKIDRSTQPTTPGFLQTVAIAIRNLKRQLQHDYEHAYPELREIIRLILDEEESRAWSLTLFPHLLLPDLVEAHVARLNLRPADTRHAKAFTPHRHDRFGNDQQIYALCA